MTPDRFTPYSCSFSGKVPRELWIDYDEEDAIDPEDADSASAPQSEDTESSADKSAARCERRVLTRRVAVLTYCPRRMVCAHGAVNFETRRNGPLLKNNCDLPLDSDGRGNPHLFQGFIDGSRSASAQFKQALLVSPWQLHLHPPHPLNLKSISQAGTFSLMEKAYSAMVL